MGQLAVMTSVIELFRTLNNNGVVTFQPGEMAFDGFILGQLAAWRLPMNSNHGGHDPHLSQSCLGKLKLHSEGVKTRMSLSDIPGLI